MDAALVSCIIYCLLLKHGVINYTKSANTLVISLNDYFESI